MLLLDEMKWHGLEPNRLSLGVVIRALESGGESYRALELMDEMRSLGLGQ